MAFGVFSVPQPTNEPILGYLPGSPERTALRAELAAQQRTVLDIPVRIAGRTATGPTGDCRCPHRHEHVLARYGTAEAGDVAAAIDGALAARASWQAMPWEARVAVFQRAAELLSGPWRQRLNAATMLGQSKNVYQAEIDAACELIDFLRFNVYYAQRISREQPESVRGVWNRVEQRPLEGFVLAVTPFNFTSIAGNLPAAPALMGNVVVWKPATTAVYSAHFLMELFREAGLPEGVITMVPGPGRVVGDVALHHRDLAGIHFTGSTDVFNAMWRTVGENLRRYRSYPRIVGETGGKDFVVVHESADVDAVVTALVRGAFEYQGQKCSAASRAYVPDVLWPALRERLAHEVGRLKMGDVEDFGCLVNAVIDQAAFDRIRATIERARRASGVEVLVGGRCDDRVGWFVEPTVVVVDDPRYETMEREIFGPLLSVYVYPSSRWTETLRLCDETSPYALTGSVFARDRHAVVEATEALRYAAGNFYVNDKPTGAVVGQQPFGGGRASGTNDKAGSSLNLLRWVSPRTIKETFVPPTTVAYPYMVED